MISMAAGGKIMAPQDDNNDTQMSGGDAFQAFLSKNDGEEDDEWSKFRDIIWSVIISKIWLKYIQLL